MKERNLCHESGCPDLCCTDRFSRFTPDEIRVNFPDARQYRWNEELEVLDSGPGTLGGVGRDGRHLVYMKGRCPHNFDGCSAPQKPLNCKTHEFAGERCNEFRVAGGLKEVSLIDEGKVKV